MYKNKNTRGELHATTSPNPKYLLVSTDVTLLVAPSDGLKHFSISFETTESGFQHKQHMNNTYMIDNKY